VQEKAESGTNELSKLVKLLAILVTDNKPQKDQIRLLSLAGLQPTEIAQLLGTSRNSVNVTLSQLRKAKNLKLKSERRNNSDE
jgi:DNA-directed RNA polymerase specialized sigma24 family protein